MFTILGCLILFLMYIVLHIFTLLENDEMPIYRHRDLDMLNITLIVINTILGLAFFIMGMVLNSWEVLIGIVIMLPIYPLAWSLDNGEGFISMLIKKYTITK